MSRWITIHTVADRLGVTLSNQQAWEIGAAIANRYEEASDARPPKTLAKKKNGGGSHCFAHYPAEWAPEFEAAIRSVQAERQRQGRLDL